MTSFKPLKVGPVSGFPEWLPHEKLVEEDIIQRIARIFRSYGYTPLETPAVERTEILASKGVEHKEIYSLVRLHATEEERSESELSLHFDLTVPFARYVAQHQDKLVFPFKRYQIQKVWRGERPAQGRFREFYQCDIDVVGQEKLGVEFDAELLDVIGEVFSALELGDIEIRMNHRLLLDGFYRSVGVSDEAQRARVLLEVDKLEKTGSDSVGRILRESLGLSAEQTERILGFAATRAAPAQLREILAGFGAAGEDYSAGLNDLLRIAGLFPDRPRAKLMWDGSITRGLNYYTGAVFETTLVGAPQLGSICSGGRYENLAGSFTRTPLPGVGISIGLTRLLSHVFSGMAPGPSSPTEVLIAVLDENSRAGLVALAREIRASGRNVELAAPGKLKKQLTYADRRKLRWTVIANEDGSYELKDMGEGKQSRYGREELIAALRPS